MCRLGQLHWGARAAVDPDGRAAVQRVHGHVHQRAAALHGRLHRLPQQPVRRQRVCHSPPSCTSEQRARRARSSPVSDASLCQCLSLACQGWSCPGRQGASRPLLPAERMHSVMKLCLAAEWWTALRWAAACRTSTTGPGQPCRTTSLRARWASGTPLQSACLRFLGGGPLSQACKIPVRPPLSSHSSSKRAARGICCGCRFLGRPLTGSWRLQESDRRAVRPTGQRHPEVQRHPCQQLRPHDRPHRTRNQGQCTGEQFTSRGTRQCDQEGQPQPVILNSQLHHESDVCRLLSGC